MTEYTTEHFFKPNVYAYKPIVEEGRRGHYSGKYEINYSGILTRLIQEAGRFCEHFASDLFIDWDGVVDYIEHANPGESKTFLFGFRQSGVDHTEFVLSRYSNNGHSAQNAYRSLWRLDIETEENEMIMTLGRVY